jgi:hypothetical protein
MTATHTGEAFGFPASGNPVAINGIDIMRVVDGKITEISHVEELLKLTQQISAGRSRRKEPWPATQSGSCGAWVIAFLSSSLRCL